jgi:uncharacterized protein (TIGR03032 family)
MEYDDEVAYHANRKIYDLARGKDTRPWCLTVSFTHPHDPYVARQKYWDLYESCEHLLPEVPAMGYKDHDALFVPRASHVTGDLDAHDVGVDASGRPIFVNTLFSCLATVADDASFAPIWTPPFISRLAAEDRCHLNGLAMRDGAPAFVTATATTDIAEGWRDHRASGGVAVDVASNEIVAQGLSMPHSPRWHDGALWLLQAGTGEFGRIDLATGRFEALCFVPGFARGLAFLGDHAIVGLSLPRGRGTFAGLPLQDRLNGAGIGPRCGLAVIDLRSGDIVHSLTIDGVVEELYDVAVIPGVRNPAMIGFRSDEIRRVIRIGDAQA